MRSTNTGDDQNNNFADLLNKFDECKSKSDWESLIQEAKQREPLTFRQREAVIARCLNSISGVFGNTKTSANLNFGKAA
jgi:hypothetical protein